MDAFFTVTAGASFHHQHGPLVEFVGRSSSGGRVVMAVAGFQAYLPVRVPESANASDEQVNKWIVNMKQWANDVLSESLVCKKVTNRTAYDGQHKRHTDGNACAVVSTKICEAYDTEGCKLERDPAAECGYSPKKVKFVEFRVIHYDLVRELHRKFQEAKAGGVLYNGYEMPVTYESNIPFVTRFSSDHNLGKWIRPNPNAKRIKWITNNQASNAFIVVCDKKCRDPVLSAELDENNNARGAPPLKILSFDLESLPVSLGATAQQGCRHPSFEDKDALIIDFGWATQTQGRPETLKIGCYALDPELKVGEQKKESRQWTADGIERTYELCRVGTLGAKKLEHDRYVAERVLPELAADVDVILGHNTDGFDWPMLKGRCDSYGLGLKAKLLNFAKGSTDFAKFLKDPGAEENLRPFGGGVVAKDTLHWAKKNLKLPSNDLSSVSGEIDLGKLKTCPYEEIPFLYKTREGRMKLADYCANDALLSLLIALHPKNNVALRQALFADVTGAEFEDVEWRGSTNMLRPALLRHVNGEFYFPSPPKKQADKLDDDTKEQKYQGATVKSAAAGYYKDPVSVGDFASLYPSSINEENISPETMMMLSDVTTLGLEKRFYQVRKPYSSSSLVESAGGSQLSHTHPSV